jgi:hypothetical protein
MGFDGELFGTCWSSHVKYRYMTVGPRIVGVATEY